MKTKEYIIEFICLLLFLLFVYTSVSKALDISRFRLVMSDSFILRNNISWLPYAIIITELFLAILLISPKRRLRGLYGSFALIFIFTVYIICFLSFSKNMPCSCGGVLQNMSWTQHLFFNLFFLFLSLVGILLSSKPISG